MNSINFQDTKSTYKNSLFLYIRCKLSGKELWKTIPFTIVPKRMKYLGIYLTQEMRDLYTENYKTLMKEIKEGTNGKASYGHKLEDLKLFRYPSYPKISTDSI